MNIENPFESGHIKNYILAYVGVVVIMVLFFIASSLFSETKKHPKKTFATKPLPSYNHKSTTQQTTQNTTIKLLPKK